MMIRKILTIITIALIIDVSTSESIENGPRVVDRLVKPMRNATVEIQVLDGVSSRIIITKNDGTQIRMELFDEGENINASTPSSITEVGPDSEWISIRHNGIIYTSVGIMSGAQRMSVIRKLPQANVPIPAEHIVGRFTDCFTLGDNVQWMGGPQLKYQRWPIQNVYLPEQHYTPTHLNNMAIAERYWFSSRGFSIWLNDYSPIFVDQNNMKLNHLCFRTENKSPYKDISLQTGYQLGFSDDGRAAHEFTGRSYWIPPKTLPDERMIRYPIWSTFGRYRKSINETTVIGFADEIIRHNFSNSQLEIDDGWESCYGYGVMDSTRFPNVTRLTNSLRSRGFRVTLWTHPFINVGCEPAYSAAVKSNFFVKSFGNSTQAQWWNGPNGAGVIDFTNRNATMFFVNKLKGLQEFGIDGFNFDAAEASRIPQIAKFYFSIPSYRPAYFTESYARVVSQYFGNISIINAGWRTQNLPMFVRMGNKNSTFTWSNGLPTLITTLLQMNLAGYFFIIPDAMGGSANAFGDETARPSKSLYIRWVQATVFMPAMHFSVPPWDYDNETVAICRKFVALHEQMAPTIIRFMNESITKRVPLHRPIWWVDPDNPTAYEINDEYLLGDEILVAPVIEENASHRDIYFPKGTWHDPITYQDIVGPRLYSNYLATLDVLPYFIRKA